MIGQTVSHYNILEKLGGGGMGVVYRAHDTKLDRDVALKFLPLGFGADEEEKKRFIQEAKAASSLDHPNVANIHEIDETDDGQLFIVMAYYKGETLKKKIARGPLGLEEAADIAIQIGQGLVKAHEHGIVHRDVKPANVIVTDEAVAKVVDFGLAKLRGRTILTKTGTTVGTAAYMSPEQARGSDVDQRSDIWSLGVVLYEMITGQLPFKADYENAMIYSIENEEAAPMTSLRTGVPMELDRIVNKAMAKSPADRYQHMDEMIVDLKRWRKDSGTKPISRPGPGPPDTSRKRWLVRSSMVFVAIVLLVVGFLIVRPMLFEEVLISEPKPIAVISFQNQTGDKAFDYLQSAIPNLLITNLEQSKYLRVMTWERMRDLLAQKGRKDVEVIDRDLGFELCRMEGVNVIVLGSYVKAGDVFVTDVKVLDVQTKQLLKSASAKGNGVSSILETQIDELSREISRGVGMSERKIDAAPLRIAEVTTSSIDAYNYFLRGRDDFEKFYYEDAKKFLEKAVELDSSFAVAYLYLAQTYGMLVDTKRRDEYYKKARMFSQKATEKERLLIEAGYIGTLGKDLEKRHQVLVEMAQKYPKEKRVLYELGSNEVSQDRLVEGIETHKKVLALDPNFGPSLNSIAYAYAELGDYETAVRYFERYASVSPGDANPFDSMAEIYWRMGKLDESIAKYQEALKVRPDFLMSRESILYIDAMRENYPEALKQSDQLIASASSPGMRGASHLVKAFLSYWPGRMNQSLVEVDRAAKEADAMGGTYLRAGADWLKAWLLYSAGDFDSGVRYYERFLRYFNNHDESIKAFQGSLFSFYRGLVDVKRGRIDSARVELAKMDSLLVRLDPTAKGRAECRRGLLVGEILMAQGKPGEAISAFEHGAVDEMPSMQLPEIMGYNTPFLRDGLARAYQLNGELDKAIGEYERLISFDPNSKDRHLIDPRYHYRLARLYEQKGLKATAVKEYKRFLELWKDADKDLPELIDTRRRLGEES